MIYNGFYTSQVVQDFFHQQYYEVSKSESLGLPGNRHHPKLSVSKGIQGEGLDTPTDQERVWKLFVGSFGQGSVSHRVLT